MGRLFTEDKKRDRNRRKNNRNLAWDEHTMPPEDLDLALEDIVEFTSLPDAATHEVNEHQEQIQTELERIRGYNRLLMISTFVLVLYAIFSILK